MSDRSRLRAAGITGATVLLGFGLLIDSRVVIAQEPPVTIRDALVRAGFGDAQGAPGARDLDEELTSSEFGVSGDTFAAVYYLRKELKGQGLGPLRVAVFHRKRNQWTAASHFKPAGSVLSVQIAPRHILLELHGNPSSGTGLVLNAETLAVATSLRGFGLRPLADGSILFSANMVHFAPTHKERVMLYDPRSRKELEIFPGPRDSAIAATYGRTLRSVYKSLPAEQKIAFESSVHGSVQDFDRSIDRITEGPGGSRIGFLVTYFSTRLGERLRREQTIVRCDRGAARWSCVERQLESVAKAHGVALPDAPGGQSKPQIDALIQAVLKGS